MSSKIRKRSGHQVQFDLNKIYKAVDSAFESCGKKCPATFRSILNQNTNKFKTAATVERIQDEIENLLLTCGYIDIYKHFSSYRAKRLVMREIKQAEIYKSIVATEQNDITNDNANMNAETPAGMMYKFGAEGTKAFGKTLLKPEYREAFESGHIHLHDFDYYAFGAFNCISEDGHIKLRTESGEVINTQLKYFDKYLESDGLVQPDENLWIQGRNGWTKVINISRRSLNSSDKLYSIKSHKGLNVKATENHMIPVLDDGKEILKYVKDIKVGDMLIQPKSFNPDMIQSEYIDVVSELLKTNCTSDIVIRGISRLKNYIRYKYNIGNIRVWLVENDLSARFQTMTESCNYLTLDEYKGLIERLDIPQEVISELSITVKNSKKPCPLYIPVTRDLAEVMGYLHSEGSITFCEDTEKKHGTYLCSFCNKDERMVNKYMDAWNRSIGTTLGKHVNNNGCYIITSSSKLHCILFGQAFGYKKNSYNISIPDFIMNGSNDIKYAYISALIDGDGCISKTALDIRYSTACKNFAEQLVMLLQSLGVESKINQSRIEGRTVYFGKHQSRSNGDIYNVVVTDSKYVTALYENFEGIKADKINPKFANLQTQAVFCEPTKIQSITEITEDVKVYDIETAEHWFVVNNVVVHNCLQSPMDRIMNLGINSGHGEARSPKRIETASFLMMISLETTQNEMFGGQGIPAFDFYLAPFVRKTYEQEIDKIAEVEALDEAKIIELKSWPITDYTMEFATAQPRIVCLAIKRTINRVYQALESFVHNANAIHSRGGNQTVFSSINYGTDTSAEGRCIIREMLRTTMAGVGDGATAIFPIQIMKMKEGVNKNPGDPNYDLYKESWPVTARRFFPNYLNLDASFYTNAFWKADDPKRYIYEPASMGCRTSVFADRFSESPTAVGRGNLSFTTINLPLLALEVAIDSGFYKKMDGGYYCDPTGDSIEAQNDRIEKFMAKLDKYCDLVGAQLHDRFEMQAKTKAYQYPLTMSGLYNGSEKLKPTDEIREVIKHGTLSIGFVGLAEALIALMGVHHGESNEAQKVGLSIIQSIYDHCNEYSERWNLNYSCFATPAESVAGKMEKVVAAKYGKIMNITSRGYFTNSNHVPVWYHCTPSEKAAIEGPYHKITIAGHIFYVEADNDITKNPEYVDAINREAWRNDMGYNAINHTNARCPRCNHEYNGPVDEAPKVCPECGEKMDVLARVTGYLSSTSLKWNQGKQAELKDRVKHK